MGALMEECGTGGGLVWVQRKNGTWWPGRVVGPNDNELLLHDRKRNKNGGIPVKLLGKPDAAVDWYNLERSKRIKAFRCGEFDDCIARAESSQGYPCEKSLKYVRREDAILHALQLEKQEVMKRHKRPGEEFQGGIRRAKRSRCVYLPNKSSNSSSTISDHQSSILQPCIIAHDSPVQSGSAGRITSSRSRGCKSFAGDFWNGEKEKSVKQASGQTELRNPRGYDEQGGSLKKEQSEQSYSSDFIPKGQTSGLVNVQKWNLQGKIKVKISRKLPGVVKSRKRVREDLLIDRSSKVQKRTESAPKSREYLVRDVNRLSQSAFQGRGNQYLDSLDNGRLNSRETMLIDIEVTVQARHRGEHVPLVSLMSRLNGRAIIGHPIEIEASDFSSSEINLPRSDDVGGKLFDHDTGSIKPQPAWRTSRRTPVCYFPLPHKPVEALENSGHSSRKIKGNSSLPQQKLLLKPLKKRELPNQYRVNGANLKPALQSCMKDKLLKSGKKAATQITCVPVELVFTKLYQALC